MLSASAAGSYIGLYPSGKAMVLVPPGPPKGRGASSDFT